MDGNFGINIIFGKTDVVKLEPCKLIMRRITLVDKIKSEINSIVNKPQTYLHYDNKKGQVFIVKEFIKNNGK